MPIGEDTTSEDEASIEEAKQANKEFKKMAKKRNFTKYTFTKMKRRINEVSLCSGF